MYNNNYNNNNFCIINNNSPNIINNNLHQICTATCITASLTSKQQLASNQAYHQQSAS
jgi:hypothetical protein